MSTAVRTHCLDASVLVKLYVSEQGSEALRDYLRGQANWYTTPFCFFEALGVLKAKYKNQKRPDKIDADQYRKAGLELAAEFATRTQNLPDISFTTPPIFSGVMAICEKYPALDFSDAFQILSVKEGYYSRMVGDSQTILVTADNDLRLAAESEGIKVHLIR